MSLRKRNQKIDARKSVPANKKWDYLLYSFLFFGLLVRGAALVRFDFWYDEAVTFIFIFNNLYLQGDNWIFPPLYFFLLDGWAHVSGYSEPALRMFSMLCNMLSLLIFYRIGRLLFNKKQAILAVGLMCFASFQIWYATEATAYALAGLLFLASIYGLLRLMKGKKGGGWLFLSCGIGCVLTDFTLIVLLAPAILYYLYSTRRELFKNAIISLVFLGGCFFAFSKTQFFNERIGCFVGWVDLPSWASIVNSYAVFLYGYCFDLNFSLAGLIFAAILFCFTMTVLIREKQFFLGVMCAAPVLLLFLLSHTIVPCYLDRKLFAMAPFFYLGVVHAFHQQRRRVFFLGGLLGVVMLSLALFRFFFYAPPFNRPLSKTNFEHGVFFKYPYKRLFEFIERRHEAGDVILYSNFDMKPLLFHYFFQQGWTPDYYLVYDEPSESATGFELGMLRSRVQKELKSLYDAYYFKREINIFNRNQLFSVIDSGDRLDQSRVIRLNDEMKRFLQFLKTEDRGRLEERLISKHRKSRPSMNMSVDYIPKLSAQRIWLISSSWGRAQQAVTRNTVMVKKYLMDHEERIDSWVIDGVGLDLFRVKRD